MPTFHHDGLELHWTERGDPGGPPVVLLHGLLFSTRLLERLSAHLPHLRVLLLDLRGHGRSSRPTDAARYSWASLAGDVLALLDHLGLERAAVGGMSLGANTTLATALAAPDRVERMVLEMPVLSRGHPLGQAAFGRMAAALAGSAPLLSPVTRRIRRVPLPRGIPELAAARDVLSPDPYAASALLRGLLDDDPLPEDAPSLSALTMPALVIGHRLDRLHHLDDARDLADRLPDGRLVIASSIVEHRLRPAKLADVLTGFLAGSRR